MTPAASQPSLAADSPIDPVAVSETVRFTAALQRGEEEAWATFHDRYRVRLVAYLARAWHGEPAVLDDLLQETLLRAVRHMRTFENEDKLWSWLTVLARSAVTDHGRRRARRWKFLRRWKREAELRSVSTAPELFAPAVDAALARLDEKSRALLKAKYYRCQSVRSLARELDTTEKAIESRLARARRKLAKLLECPNSP